MFVKSGETSPDTKGKAFTPVVNPFSSLSSGIGNDFTNGNFKSSKVSSALSTQKPSGGVSTVQNNVEMNVQLAPGTTNEQAEELMSMVEERISQDNEAAISAAPLVE